MALFKNWKTSAKESRAVLTMKLEHLGVHNNEVHPVHPFHETVHPDIEDYTVKRMMAISAAKMPIH